jgi:hypothetical protein
VSLLRDRGRELAILRAAMRALTVTIAIGAALALGACGGDDNDNASNNTATTQTTGTQGTGAAKSKQNGKKGGKPAGGSATSGGSNTTQTQTGTQPEGGTTSTTPATPKTPYAIAKTVCQNIVPTIVKRQLKKGKTTKQKVAKQYSTGWKPEQRKDAYRGCLAGLKKAAF